MVYLQGGWYDFFLRGMLADYAALRAAGRTVRLLIGPWGHGRGLYTRVGMRDAFAALDGAIADGTLPSGVRAFVTGSRRWIDLPGWPPPARNTAWYLHPGGRLDARPASAGPPSRYRYDPADPSPSIAGTAVGLSAGPADNRRLEARPDVLTFTSDPQAVDLEVIGPVRVRLHVTAEVPYIDLHARLCDVTPRGRSINISDGIMRLTDAAADTPRLVEFDLWPVAHTFLRRHRIRLQVSGGAHPRYGRNPGTADRSPLARACRQATAHYSTTLGTPLRCGYRCTADLHCRLRRLALEVKADEPATRTLRVKLRSGTAPRGERVARRPVAAPPVDGQHGWQR